MTKDNEKNIPYCWINTTLGTFMKNGTGLVDPSKFPQEEFELYSIPAYSVGKPERFKGSQIGSSKKVVIENDVLLSRIVPHIQRSWVVGKSQGLRQIGSGEWIIFDSTGINPKYLRFFLLSYGFHVEYMKTISGVGGSLTRANANQTALFNFPLPPLIEQHRIVNKIEELFSSLDKGIESLLTAQQQLKVYRQAVLKWAFEGKLTHENVKDEELPEGWIWRTIAEVCEMKAGFFVKASDINKDYENGLFPCYGGNGLRGYVKSSTHEGIFPLVGRQGALCGNVHLVNGKFHATEHAVVVTANKLMNIKWLYYKLISMKLNQYSTGVAQPGLSVNKILPLKLTVPPKTEQQRIVSEIESRLSVCDKIEETITQSLRQAEALRQSILKKAFEGKLVPQDPADEPACVLLEKIRAEKAKSGSVSIKNKTVKKNVKTD